MLCKVRNNSFATGAMTLLLLLWNHSLTAAADELETVIHAWERRARQVRTLVCVAEGHMVTPKGAYDDEPSLLPGTKKPVPASDTITDLRRRWVIDFDKNLMRSEERGSAFHTGLARFTAMHLIKVWNGKEFRVYEPRATNYVPGPTQPEFYFHGKSYGGFLFSAYERPVFFGAGRVRIFASLNPLDRSVAIDRDRLRIVEPQRINGQRLIVIRARNEKMTDVNYSDYWVDPAKDYNIVKVLTYYRSHLMSRFDITLAQKNGMWWPWSWTYQYFVPRDPPALDGGYRLAVTSLKVNVPLDRDEFELEPPVGSVVLDARNEQLYRVMSDGSLRETTLDEIVAQEKGKTGRIWLVVILSVGIFVLLIVVLWRVRSLFLRHA